MLIPLESTFLEREEPMFKLPELPYALNALEPHISKETLDFHYGKHHKTYVDKLNELVPGTPFAKASLEDIIREAEGAIFNNGAQVWNHTFYWNCLSPNGGGEPSGGLMNELLSSFKSFRNFREQFEEAGKTLFGSGWIWLVKKKDGSLAIENSKDADNPLRHGQTPILTCDVWEHAYYIDYRNARDKYLTHFWNLVEWEFVEKQLES